MAGHLTQPNPELQRLVDQTPPGMAHWAGTGPAGTKCQDCAFFNGKKRRTGIGVGEIQPGRCRKFITMMRHALASRNAPTHLVPPKTMSCKHFEPMTVKGPPAQPRQQRLGL